MRRTIRYLSTALSLTILMLGVSAAPALATPEGSFVAEINATRQANGLAPLEVYWDLEDDAEAHSKAMKAASELYHNPNLAAVTTGWYGLAENVGVGPDVARLHQAFMDSSGHRKNILGDYNYVGVGVVRESETKIWVTVVFMRGPEGLVSPSEPEPEPVPEPTPLPVPEPQPPAVADEPASQPDSLPAADPQPVAAPEPEAVPDTLQLIGHPPGMRPIVI